MSLDLRIVKLLCAILALVCAGSALAQTDERWIVEHVVAGRYDELRAVEAESDKGSPVAMYWWASFLDACLFEKCDPEGAKQLWLRAARAGNSQAKLSVLLG